MAIQPSQQVIAKPRTIITVRCIRSCTAVDVKTGRQPFRKKGEVFQVFDDCFVGECMVREEDGRLPDVTVEPPPTSLPLNMQPRPIH